MSFDVKKSNLLAEKNVPFEFFWEYLKFRLKSWQYLELLLNILQTIFASWILIFVFSEKRIPISDDLLYGEAGESGFGLLHIMMEIEYFPAI